MSLAAVTEHQSQSWSEQEALRSSTSLLSSRDATGNGVWRPGPFQSPNPNQPVIVWRLPIRSGRRKQQHASTGQGHGAIPTRATANLPDNVTHWFVRRTQDKVVCVGWWPSSAARANNWRHSGRGRGPRWPPCPITLARTTLMGARHVPSNQRQPTLFIAACESGSKRVQKCARPFARHQVFKLDQAGSPGIILCTARPSPGYRAVGFWARSIRGNNQAFRGAIS